jgi:hypothetical protein
MLAQQSQNVVADRDGAIVGVRSQPYSHRLLPRSLWPIGILHALTSALVRLPRTHQIATVQIEEDLIGKDRTDNGCVAKLRARPSRDMIVADLATVRSTVVEFKGRHFEREVILWGVRRYVAYPITYRQLEEMMEE